MNNRIKVRSNVSSPLHISVLFVVVVNKIGDRVEAIRMLMRSIDCVFVCNFKVGI